VMRVLNGPLDSGNFFLYDPAGYRRVTISSGIILHSLTVVWFGGWKLMKCVLILCLLRNLKILAVVLALISPFPGIMCRLSPSPAVMSSFWMMIACVELVMITFLVLPSMIMLVRGFRLIGKYPSNVFCISCIVQFVEYYHLRWDRVHRIR